MFSDAIKVEYRIDNGTVNEWKALAKQYDVDSFKRRPVPRSMNETIITLEWRKHSWAASNDAFAPFKQALGNKHNLYRFTR
jgi:hypothetical protein